MALALDLAGTWDKSELYPTVRNRKGGYHIKPSL